MKALDKSLDEALSEETKESLEAWAESVGATLEDFKINDHVTHIKFGKGKLTGTFPDKPGKVYVYFPEEGFGRIVEIEDLILDPPFRIKDKVEVISGILKGRTGVVEDIEYCLGDFGYTVSVDIPNYGSYVHDSTNFRPKKLSDLEALKELKRKMDSGEMKTLDESLPEASKIIDDNFFDLLEDNEFSLLDLLKGHEGETFYYLGVGDVVLEELQERYDEPYQFKFTRLGYSSTYFLSIHGTYHSGDGTVILYPTKELYQKYPIDPITAWMEWDKSLEYKLEILINTEKYKLIFNSKEERKEALEEINKVIEKYGKRN